MKKFLNASAILFFLIALAPHAFAQSVPPGGNCTQDSDCMDTSAASYGCYPEGGGICTVDGDAPADGTVQPGGACTNDASCADLPNGQSYGCYTGNYTCTADGDAPTCTVNAGCVNYGTGWTCQIPSGQTSGTCVAPAAGANTTSTGGLTCPGGGTGFCPLAPIPGLDQGVAANSTSIPIFLNNLYKFLIGIAASLAVIQIIRGGLEYSTQDSVSKKGEGKQHIEQAIFGLVLVLLPALVFSIVNPSIINLSLNLPPLNTAAGTSTPATNGGAPLVNGQVSGTYLKKLASSDATQLSNFQSACGTSGGKLTNSCQTVNSSTGQPNCPGTNTLECEEPSPQPFIWFGWYQNDLSLKAFIEQFTTSTLYPAVQAEVSGATTFINTCQSDGGVVCTTDGNVEFEASGAFGGDYIICPPSGQLAQYAVPVDDDTFCEKSLNMYCMDPNISNSGCNSYWKFAPSP